MSPRKMWALFAVTPLAQVMVVWLQPAPRALMIGYVIPLVMAGGLVFTFGCSSSSRVRSVPT